MTAYGKEFEYIVAAMDDLMQPFSHTKKDIGYGYRRTFTNKLRVDLINYRKKWIYIFRVWRGAWLVKKYPILHGMFDVVSKVIAKIEISNIEVLEKRGIGALLGLMSEEEWNIGVRD